MSRDADFHLPLVTTAGQTDKSGSFVLQDSKQSRQQSLMTKQLRKPSTKRTQDNEMALTQDSFSMPLRQREAVNSNLMQQAFTDRKGYEGQGDGVQSKNGSIDLKPNLLRLLMDETIHSGDNKPSKGGQSKK